MHKRCPLYANGVILEYKENTATIWLADALQVVIQGPNPKALLQEVKRMVEDTGYVFAGVHWSIYFLCPQCIVNMIERENDSKRSELPNDVISSKYAEDELGGKEYLICMNKHRIRTSCVTSGISIESTPKLVRKSEIQSLFSELEKLRASGIQTIQEAQSLKLETNISLIKFISSNWLSFGLLFPQIENEIADVRFHSISNVEKATLTLHMITSASTLVPISLFIENLRKVLEIQTLD